MSKTAAKRRQSTLTNDLSHQNGVTYDESLAATIHTYVKLAIVKFSHYFQGVELHNWDFLCDVRPDCQHHFDAG